VTEPDPADRRIRLTLHYDGEGFHGWQVQPGVRTVQAEVEAALSRITDRPASVIAAGRTDRGVHATGQVVSTAVPASWRPATLARSLNAVLPADIWVSTADAVPDEFHARYSAVARGYAYRVGTRTEARSPFVRRWCWPVGQPLAPDLLEQAANRFTGTHSFKAFAKSGQPERGEHCTVLRAQWRPWAATGLEFRVTANRFLHHMVRYMVGTMVDVGRGRRPLEDIDGLLRNDAGVETSPPAPAGGLFLRRVYYDLSELEEEGMEDDRLTMHD
jgi:tRNA pseudouridine38-40 synthase